MESGHGLPERHCSSFRQTYVLEYLQAMMQDYKVTGEETYGPKKARHRTPDVLIRDASEVVAVLECKAKRMSLDARYADDLIAAAAVGFDELAKGIFQIWRFLAHARLRLTHNVQVLQDYQAIMVTADSWLTMARNEAERVLAAAHALADAEGGIDAGDRRDIAFCQIDDVEFALQNGTADSFLIACREIATGEKRAHALRSAYSDQRCRATIRLQGPHRQSTSLVRGLR